MRRSWHHHEEEEEEEEEDSCSNPEGQMRDPKASSYRSKHSETEQRRRTKINHRFSVLRELIPTNNKKRDKASLLLEVIQHIKLLEQKLKQYEASRINMDQDNALEPNLSLQSNNIPIHNPHFEDSPYQTTSTTVSNVFSQGLLRKLTEALQTSGVHVSQANISVQLDVAKRENGVSMGIATAADVGNNRSSTSQLRAHPVGVSPKESVQTIKRFRTGES